MTKRINYIDIKRTTEALMASFSKQTVHIRDIANDMNVSITDVYEYVKKLCPEAFEFEPQQYNQYLAQTDVGLKIRSVKDIIYVVDYSLEILPESKCKLILKLSETPNKAKMAKKDIFIDSGVLGLSVSSVENDGNIVTIILSSNGSVLAGKFNLSIDKSIFKSEKSFAFACFEIDEFTPEYFETVIPTVEETSEDVKPKETKKK